MPDDVDWSGQRFFSKQQSRWQTCKLEESVRFPYFSDCAYDSVAYDLVRTRRWPSRALRF